MSEATYTITKREPCDIANCDIEHESDVSLSLLIIDMGEGCIVRVEKGSLPDDCHIATGSSRIDNLIVSAKPFTELRAAIDADFAEDERPVPRIERRHNRESPWLYQLIDPSGAADNYLTPIEYNALSALARSVGATADLPIYSPKPAGTWTSIGVEPDTETGTNPAIWRYVRK